ncbi:MAG: DEAD/DEAH box helicase [Armatimonadetes bacterium]|nr:DEAD/DEAH box helicase [Armatimonadota bacterium]
MDADAFLDRLRRDRKIPGGLAAQWRTPPREATYEPVPRDLPADLLDALDREGLTRLYSHQAQALGLAAAGRNFVMVTGTASGKTLCYNLPTLRRLFTRRTARALYLYPTKALAHDQARALERLLGPDSPLRVAAYDGDTAGALRPGVRRHAHIVLSNPDMLHLAILPNHKLWAEFFSNIEFVVVDELHTYHGIFGSNVAHVFRRLRRVCESYGSSPLFIASSATVANPGELAYSLVGLPFEVIDEDGSPAAGKTVAVWNPVLAGEEPGRQVGAAHGVAARLLARLVRERIRTIAFVQSRQGAETLLLRARGLLKAHQAADSILAYRGGYLPEERREIERQLAEGDLLAVISTPALELGIDIGALEACLTVGYPGTVASLWQQAGRVGRAGGDSLFLFIPQESTLDQYLARHPEQFGQQSVERATADPGNRFILGAHLLCAAKELPFSDEEAMGVWEGCSELPEVIERLSQAGYLEKRSRWFCAQGLEPAADTSLRSATGKAYEITNVETSELVGTVDGAMALVYLHPEAIYLHQGRKYLVQDLDEERREARVRPSDAPYTTTPRIVAETEVIEELAAAPSGQARVIYAEMTLTTTLIGYTVVPDFGRSERQGVELVLPPNAMETTGIIFAFSPSARQWLEERGRDALGSLHAFEHAAVGVMPLLCSCGPHDVMGYSILLDAHTAGPVVCLADNHPGGVGIAESAFERRDELLAMIGRAISECPCPDGCPGCVQQPSCGSDNRPLDKAGALDVLALCLGQASQPAGAGGVHEDVEAEPRQGDEAGQPPRILGHAP